VKLRLFKSSAANPAGSRGQALVVFALALVAIVAMVGLVLDGGNAYAQQRVTQNGADAAANAGAVVLAQRLGGIAKTDADVATAVDAIANSPEYSFATHTGYYTNLTAQKLDVAGNVAANSGQPAAQVGGGTIPTGAQGVQVDGSRTFGTSFSHVVGISTMGAAATATAVTGRLVGGPLLPVVFPVNVADCEQNGSLGPGEDEWALSGDGTPHPVGQEYIVPLCKTGGGSFQILDLDGQKNNCADEVTNPPAIQFPLPTWIDTDNGNNCAKQMVDAVNALHGTVVLIPICDGGNGAPQSVTCGTANGSNAQYHIIKVAGFFVDYMDDSNNKNNSNCKNTTSPSYGTPITPIFGNGSSSCLTGWFVKYITQGPVGPGDVTGSDAIGIQLIR
jgi:Flp pilus assembly protein TadG